MSDPELRDYFATHATDDDVLLFRLDDLDDLDPEGVGFFRWFFPKKPDGGWLLAREQAVTDAKYRYADEMMRARKRTVQL